METIIKATDFEKVADSVRVDSRKRVTLPKSSVGEGITYHVHINSFGQIMLDPQKTISASEAWVFENKNILAMIDRGMAEERTMNLGSFAKYVNDAP